MAIGEIAVLLGAGLGVSSATRVALIEKCSEALGGALKPWQIRRVAQANADARVIDAKADQEIEALAQRTVDRQLSEGMRDQRNIEAVLSKALPGVEDDAKPEQIEVDWLANFLDKSRLISNEDMQNLLAQILAGEANRPGSISARTVNFMATLTQREALSFQKVCSSCWNIEGDDDYSPLIRRDALSELPVNLSEQELTHLDHIGLLEFNIGLLGGYIFPMSATTVSYHGHVLKVETLSEEKDVLPAGQVRLSAMGMEIASICSPPEVPGVVEYVIKHIFKECQVTPLNEGAVS